MADTVTKRAVTMFKRAAGAAALSMLTACSSGGSLSGSNDVLRPTGRVIQQGNYIHAYFDSTGTVETTRDVYTYEDFGPQGAKMPDVGKCFARTLTWRERRTSARNPYPIRPGYTQIRCMSTVNFTPIGAYSYY